MKTAGRIFKLAANRPAEALEDVLGLSAMCVLVFIGFVATNLA